jgi:hypothetical protein
MNADGGLGEVVSKNIHLRNDLTEGMAAIKHANGKDYWLITHGSSNSFFYVYGITESGIQLPIESNIGRPLTHEHDRLACTKVSPSGKKLFSHFMFRGISSYSILITRLGIVSNPKTISSKELYWGYGFEFSPNEQFLYTSSRTKPSYLLQFDISLQKENDISNSKEIISIEPKEFLYGALQLAPNGKIYHAKSQSKSIGVINNPDEKGTACNYVKDGLNLGLHKSGIGLPNFPQNQVAPNNCINGYDYNDFALSDGITFVGQQQARW